VKNQTYMKTVNILIALSILNLHSIAQSNKEYFNKTTDKPVRELVNINFNSFFELAKKLDTSELKIDSVYTSDSTKIKVYRISKALTFINCIVNLNYENNKKSQFGWRSSGRNMSIDSVIFKEKVSFFHTNVKSFYLQNAIFEKSCIIGFIDNKLYDSKELAEFLNTTFNSNLSIFSENPTEIKESQSQNQYAFSRKTDNDVLYNISFVNNVFNKSLTIRSANLKNIKFTKSVFNAPFILSYKTLDSTIIENCEFYNAVDLRGIKLIKGSLLRDNFFTKKCNIIIRTTDELDKMNIDNISLQKVFFMIDWDWISPNLQYVYWDDNKKTFFSRQAKWQYGKGSSVIMPTVAIPDLKEQNLEQIKLKFQNIKDHISRNTINDDLFGSGKQKIFSWIDYQQKQYEKLFYKTHGNRLNYYWLCFIQTIVNYGYKGEGVFIFYCLLIIFFFAFIYRIYFVNEIEAYVNDAEVINKNNQDNYKTIKSRTHRVINLLLFILKIINIDLIKSFFASFAIFFTPKFPFKVFKFSNGFSWFVIIEWIIGIWFILLFLYFIAGNYPIVTKLIGF
jgi:hypothetical protein